MWNIDSEVEGWERSFTMPYFEVRERLYEIAFGDVESLGFDAVFQHVDDKVMSEVEGLSDFWVVPVDDDDWISPRLSESLRRFKSDEPMCHWGAWRFDQTSISKGRPELKVDFRSGLDMVRSCAYAVRPSLGREVMTDHGKTRGISGASLGGAHSFYTRTPASTTVLKYRPMNGIDVFKMWAGMLLLPEYDVPCEFSKKILLLKDLFKECRPRRSLL